MGYFANGTEGDMFEASQCAKCVHDNDETGCPVMLAHVLYSYVLCNEKEHPGKVILDMLIPRKGAYNEDCAMFAPKVRK
jgi:hypothetical protein